jgi:hypothetical protein
VKSQWFADRNRYEFAKCLAEADYSLQSWDLMDVFLTCAVMSMRQAYQKMMFQPLRADWEERYQKSIARVKHPEKIKQCYAILAMGLEARGDDFLGSTIQELGQADVAWRGQCFTPPALCTVMAQMMMGDLLPDPNNRIVLQEPACGGGAMVIASSQVLAGNGFYPWNYYWTCVDVDWRMFAICFLQCSLLGIPATVIHGNTLSLETWDSAPTFAAVMHPLRKKRDQKPEVEAIAMELEPVPVVDVPVVSEVASQTYKQLSLF